MVGYVDEVYGTTTCVDQVKNREFKVFKFILNNSDGCRIQCNIYDKNIDCFMNQIKINKVILKDYKILIV